MGICHPLTHLKWGTKNITKIFIIATWIVGPIIGLYFIHSSTRVVNGICAWKLVKDITEVDTIVFPLTHYFIPVVMLVLLYALIVKELHDKLKAYKGSEFSSAKNTFLAKTTTVKMLITVVMFSIICWTGLMVDYILVKTETLCSDPVFITSELIIFLNCCCNPIIYIFHSKSYRSKIVGLFPSVATSSTALGN